jgi:leucyl-tRNA synthetase
MKTFDHTNLEAKWQKRWEEQGLYTTPDAVEGKENAYMLVEFPYPSGNLHIGHWYAFAVPDIYARYLRMNGKNVLYPIGFDAFGLPAENAAIKRGLDPRKWTYDNIDFMMGQLKSMGNSFDWSRKVVTCDPEYYKWTQWLFLQLFEKGLAYKKQGTVPWCDSCKTVLANEQIVSGACERCGTAVLQKDLDQWYFKITEYADRLLADLDALDWPEEIKQAQREWIGKSAGALLQFRVKSLEFREQTAELRVAGDEYRVPSTESRVPNATPRVVLLHGFTGRADKNFIPWLKDELEKQGYEVQAPQLPNTNTPTEEEQVAHVLKNCTIDESTIFVGHSLGGVVAMKVIEKLPHAVGGLVLVAPAVEPAFRTGEPRYFWDTFDITYDYNTIKSKTSFRLVLSDTLENEYRGAYLAHLAKNIEAKLLETTAKRIHFCGNTEPFVLDSVVSTIEHQWAQETGSDSKLKTLDSKLIEVFTTRPDTLYGVTYVVLAPEHTLVQELKGSIENWDEVLAYVEVTKAKKELERKEGKEKTGVELKGVRAVNPANGEEVPVWIADYVLASYGTGVVMAVPAHDERDFEFAKKYELSIRQVIQSRVYEKHVCPDEKMGSVLDGDETSSTTPYTMGGFLVHSDLFTGMDSEEAKTKITEHAGGTMTTQYRLRDWLLSRQRYWGAPIPIVYDPEGNPHPIPAEHLPWKLPDDVDFTPTGEAPLATSNELKARTEKIFGKGWTPEVDTMDTFVCSSWYFLRYLDPHNDSEFSSIDMQRAWMPVDRYSGGAEHTTMHLLYSRFFYKALSDLGLVTKSEPYTKRMSRGLILGPDGQKMSKSKGNVIEPDEHVKRVGSDTVKMYLAFVGPYNEVGQYPWDLGGIAGVRRFLERVWNLKDKVENIEKDVESTTLNDTQNSKLLSLNLSLHQTIKKVGEDIDSFKFNTAISQMMILMNALEKLESIPLDTYESLIRILAPFAPHLTEELWQSLGHTTSVHFSLWPSYDASVLESAQSTIVVQVNGKTRGMFTTEPNVSDEDMCTQALAVESVQPYLANGEVLKTVVVPGRLVNFVVKTPEQ